MPIVKSRVFWIRTLVFLLSGILLRWLSLGLPNWESISSYWAASDSLSAYAWINIIHDENWLPFMPIQSGRLAFPEGLNFHQSPMIDSFHWMGFRFLRLFVESSVAVYNLYYLIGAGLICVTMGFLCLNLGLPFSLALVSGLLYSSVPFAFERIHHLFLSVYFDVPLGILLALVIVRKTFTPWKVISVSALIGMTGLYYTFFSLSFLSVAFCLFIFQNWGKFSLKSLGQRLVFFFAPAILVVALGMLPTFIGAMKEGPSGGMVRSPEETLIWGLRLQNIFLPPTNHFIPAYSQVRSLFFDSQYLYQESIYEGYQEYLGLLAIIGLFFGFFFFLRQRWRQSHPHNSEIIVLAVAAVWFLVYGIRYGLGYQFSFYVTPQIRSVNRVSIYIAALGLLIFFLWFSNTVFYKNIKSQMLKFALAGLILIFGLIEMGTLWRPIQPKVEETRSDQKFSSDLKNSLGDHPVLKLPFGVFPEWPGYPSKESYAAFRFLAYEKVHSIFPVIKGTKSSVGKVRRFFGRIPSWSEITEFGLRGVVIDRMDYDDQGREAIQSLSYVGAIAFDSPNGRFHFIKAPN